MRLNWEFETCACCTREQRLVWLVDNELWNQVVIKHYRRRILCLECFLRMADDRGIKVTFDKINFLGTVSRGHNWAGKAIPPYKGDKL